MVRPIPRTGSVLRYSFLWKDEQTAGHGEGRKDRPAAVILTHRDNATGQTLVYVLPITHSPPNEPEWAIEIPPDEKRRLGLDGDRSWIICSETNRFLWPGHDLRPIPGVSGSRWEYGMLSRSLFEGAKSRFLECRKIRRTKIADRD